MGDESTKCKIQRIDIATLVNNYKKLQALTGPYLSLRSLLTSLLTWSNITTSSLTLLLISTLLVYPAYLQCVSVGVVSIVFGFGYLKHISEEDEPHSDLTNVNPQDFINPQFYSLQPVPDKSVISTIEQYKDMLVELDTVIKDLVKVSEVCADILYWRDIKTSGVTLILLLSVGILPSFVELNYIMLMIVLIMFCYNSYFVVALTTLLSDDIMASDPAPTSYKTGHLDSDSDTSSDTSVGELYRYFSFEDEVCGSCDKTVSYANVVKCYFCSGVYCNTCCGNIVTKETLGVTNPYTKDQEVKVCVGCFSGK